MNYKDHLFFVAQCLTITHEAKNRKIILDQLKSNLINWNEVVKISTVHYVLPALYLHLKEQCFLEWIPIDLQRYMKYITALNFERNREIVEQAKEIRKWLLEKNITPIFIKGTGNLLEGLYDNFSERMVGDIDFIVSEDNYDSTIKLLQNRGYIAVHPSSSYLPQSKHYPRLQKQNSIAAVEVHRAFTNDKYAKHFNYSKVEPHIQVINKSSVLSYQDQLSLSIIAYHLNDNGKDYYSISLRAAYDIFLLSKKVDTLTVLKDNRSLKKDFNNFLALCALVLNQPSSIIYQKNKNTRKYLEKCKLFLTNSPQYKDHYRFTKRKLIWNSRYNTLKKAFISKAHRSWLLKRICEKEWQNARMAEFGLFSKLRS